VTFFGSHNPDAVRKLVHFLRQEHYNNSIETFDLLVLSFSKRSEKDLMTMVKQFLTLTPQDIEYGQRGYDDAVKRLRELFFEDLYKTTEDLKKFEKFKNRLPENLLDISKLKINTLFDNVKDFIKYIEELIIDKKNLLSTMNIKDYYKTGMKAQYKFFNIEWVLQEYIDNPLLFNEKKFHIRGYFIYHYFNSKETEKKEKKYYISKNMKIFTAISPYKNNDYYNKDIHDTHAGSSIKGLSFYNDLSNMLGKDKTNYVYEQIKNIFKYVGKIINSKCFEEALNCFHIFGYDVMITENLDVKIIETNYRPGYPRLDIFDGIMTKIIDYHFPPLNIQEDSDNIN
jgi:hypothetical protein